MPEPNNTTFPSEIMSGLAGDFARLYHQYLESPEQFFYFSFLTCLGSYLSGRVTLDSELKDQPRLYTVLLGESADTRKSTAMVKTTEFFRQAMEGTGRGAYFGDNFQVCLGVGSAEGLQRYFNNEDQATNVLMVLDEFKVLVSKCSIKGSILLPCVNTLFHSNRYQNRTKRQHIRVRNAHLSLLSACTLATWEGIFTPVFTDIGLPNRLWIVPGESQRRFAVPQVIPEDEKRPIMHGLREVLEQYRESDQESEIRMNESARELFQEWYLNEMPTGPLAKRLDTYLNRLALLLTVNSGFERVNRMTIERAIALVEWQFRVRRACDPIDCETRVGQMEQKIQRILGTRGQVTEKELRNLCNAHRVGLWTFRAALDNLQGANIIRRRRGRRRDSIVWTLME